MKAQFIREDTTLPIVLYKNFSDEEHLIRFKTKGNILVRKIEFFHKVDNQRQDITENTAMYKYQFGDNTINGAITSVNPTYILSTSGPLSDRNNCRHKFGVYEVKIINADQFKNELNNAWNHNPLALRGINAFRVEYSKGEFREIPEAMLEPHGISTWQKSKIYSNEDEYRFVFTCKMNADIEYPDSISLIIDSSIANQMFE
jgi:hypothetical protein